jgi:hypothetical protein
MIVIKGYYRPTVGLTGPPRPFRKSETTGFVLALSSDRAYRTVESYFFRDMVAFQDAAAFLAGFQPAIDAALKRQLQ